MRRANGTGSITKVTDTKRRKPYRVRVTVGSIYDLEEGKTRKGAKTLGYFATRAQAEKALADYFSDPYDINTKQMTFAELYKLWSDHHFERLRSDSAVRAIEVAYRYCWYLYDKPIRSIKLIDIEKCIRDASAIALRGKNKGEVLPASANTKKKIKSILNLMFEFAAARDLVVKNYAKMYQLSPRIAEEIKENKKEVTVFTDEELIMLWDAVDKYEFVDMVLVSIYSGWRPKELAILKVQDVDLDKQTMIGGLKTDAGRNRKVPIHSAIYPLVKARYEEAVLMESEYLFNDFNSLTGSNLNYDKYYDRFQSIMNELGMYHRPHETRHTFITLADRYGMDFYTCKRLIGHTIADITKGVYTHETVDDLREELEKIPKIPSRDRSKVSWSVRSTD